MPNWPQFGAGAGDWPASGADTGGATPPVSHFPLPGWPAQGTVEYLTKLIVLGLILLALPYLVGRLIFHPSQLMRMASAQAVKGSI